jgi:hypothetical protein
MDLLLINIKSERQRQYKLRLKLLQALLEGDSLELAADRVGIAYGTAREHTAILRRLNGNITITGVVVLAVAHGLINIPEWMQPEQKRRTSLTSSGASSRHQRTRMS